MADTAAANSGKARGASFPVMALPKAASYIKTIAVYGRQHTSEAMAGYLGHETANSGPFRTKIAALRDWGLITGKGDSIALTDRAMAIGLPNSPGDAPRAMAEAFRGCNVFWSIYENSAKGTALAVEMLGNRAVNNNGVAPGSRGQFVKSLVDSAVAVGLAEKVDAEHVKFLAEASASDQPSHADTEPDIRGEGVSGQPTPVSRRPPTPTEQLIRQVWAVEHGELVFELRLAQPAPASAFGQIAKVVGEAEALAQVLGVPEVLDDDVPD